MTLDRERQKAAKRLVTRRMGGTDVPAADAMGVQLRRLKAAAKAYAQADVPLCRWSEQNSSGFRQWATQCGHEFGFTLGTPEDGGFRFCGFCGGRLEVQSWESV